MDHSAPSTLLLFPTEFERVCFGEVGGVRGGGVIAETCGFGPVAAAARTAQLLSRIRPRRAILIGIAGTYDERRLPVGAATAFDEVVLDGVGAGQGGRHENPSALGFSQWPGSNDTCDGPVRERLLLEPLQNRAPASPKRLLLTACSASASPSEAETRRGTYKDALAEDMEAFAVALACALHRVPVAVVRGISNVAGDRQRNNWKIEPALREAARLVQEAIDGSSLQSQEAPR